MVTLNFTLTPEASARLHDSLTCLAKFSDTVSIEARKDTVSVHEDLGHDRMTY
jgi:cell cycle checkpoint control protein RAD9A